VIENRFEANHTEINDNNDYEDQYQISNVKMNK